MILYDFTCTRGHRFEAAVASMDSPAPTCSTCGDRAHRRPSAVTIGGTADTGIPRERMPRTWNAVGGGDRQAVAHWHKIARRRETLEERHPHLAVDRRPVLAHEGIFEGRPLRAGDDISASVADAATAGAATESAAHHHHSSTKKKATS